MKIPFMKMSGSGNDFILIDHRKPFLKEEQYQGFARKVCRRRVSVGAARGEHGVRRTGAAMKRT